MNFEMDIRLAKFVAEVVAADLPPLNSRLIKDTYWSRLKELGLARTMRYKMEDITDSLKVFYGPEYLTEFTSTIGKKNYVPLWLRRTLWVERFSNGALYHTLVSLYLFGDFKSFSRACAFAS